MVPTRLRQLLSQVDSVEELAVDVQLEMVRSAVTDSHRLLTFLQVINGKLLIG